jgi:CDP-diacylglycerol pyrophosphatase
VSPLTALRKQAKERGACEGKSCDTHLNSYCTSAAMSHQADAALDASFSHVRVSAHPPRFEPARGWTVDDASPYFDVRGASPLLRIVASFSIAVVLSALAGVVPALAGFADGRRGALWEVVRTCLVNHTVTGFAFPCLEVNTDHGEERGYVVLRRPGTPDIVLAPTKQVVGVEDPWLRTAEAPNYFGDAWNARSFLDELRRRPLGHEDVALAVNSQLMRAQDQLHIHIGCISPVARRAIGLVAPDLSDSDWTRLNWHVHGPDVWARRISQSSLDGVNPFRLAEGIRDGDAKLAPIGIVVAGTELADGRDGFVELAWIDDVTKPGGSLTADGLLDPGCSH